MRPRFYQGERARVRISRGAQPCETSKESNRISQRVHRKQGILAQNRGIPQMSTSSEGCCGLMNRSRQETPGHRKVQLKDSPVPAHSPRDTSVFVPESAILRVLFRRVRSANAGMSFTASVSLCEHLPKARSPPQWFLKQIDEFATWRSNSLSGNSESTVHRKTVSEFVIISSLGRLHETPI